MIVETIRRHLVLLISLFLCVGLVATAGANVVATSSSLVGAKFTQDSANQLHAFMSQEARNAKDVNSPTAAPPIESYLDWRDIDWKDPFVRNGQVRIQTNSNVPTPKSAIKLELKMQY